ncbi:unnamed protein product [Ectocarpus sp. 12 AP-2014]
MRLGAIALVASASLALLMPVTSFILLTCPHTTSIGERQGQSAAAVDEVGNTGRGSTGHGHSRRSWQGRDGEDSTP